MEERIKEKITTITKYLEELDSLVVADLQIYIKK